MGARKTKRRSPGEGGCFAYQTKAGDRWRAAGPVIMPDGTARIARKRGFLTKKAGPRMAGRPAGGRPQRRVHPAE